MDAFAKSFTPPGWFLTTVLEKSYLAPILSVSSPFFLSHGSKKMLVYRVKS